jgi:hypothetical protein
MGMGQVIVQRQQYHESEEHSDGAQKVPNVVEVIKSQ